MQKVSISIKNLAVDKIVSIDGSTLQAPILAKDYIYDDPQPNFWIEKDNGGYPALCTNLPDTTDMVLVMRETLGDTYEAHRCDFVGGRPIVIK